MTSFALVEGTSLMVDSDGNVYGPRGPRRQTPGTNEYLGVSVAVNGRRETHRMVAKAFVPNPDNKPQVAHWDNDKSNNHAGNLRWATRLENHADRWRHNAWGTKLSKEDVVEIRRLLRDGDLRQYEIAAKFGITPTAGIAHPSWQVMEGK